MANLENLPLDLSGLEEELGIKGVGKGVSGSHKVKINGIHTKIAHLITCVYAVAYPGVGFNIEVGSSIGIGLIGSCIVAVNDVGVAVCRNRILCRGKLTLTCKVTCGTDRKDLSKEGLDVCGSEVQKSLAYSSVKLTDVGAGYV